MQFGKVLLGKSWIVSRALQSWKDYWGQALHTAGSFAILLRSTETSLKAKERSQQGAITQQKWHLIAYNKINLGNSLGIEYFLEQWGKERALFLGSLWKRYRQESFVLDSTYWSKTYVFLNIGSLNIDSRCQGLKYAQVRRK